MACCLFACWEFFTCLTCSRPWRARELYVLACLACESALGICCAYMFGMFYKMACFAFLKKNAITLSNKKVRRIVYLTEFHKIWNTEKNKASSNFFWNETAKWRAWVLGLRVSRARVLFVLLCFLCSSDLRICCAVLHRSVCLTRFKKWRAWHAS